MQMLINSQWVDASDGQRIEVRNPANGELIDTAPKGTLDDVRRAVEAAQEGKRRMGRLPAHERATILFRVADALEKNEHALGELLARENGKPVQQTRAEVAVTARIFRGFGEEAKRMFGRVVPMHAVPGQERHLAMTIRQPVGVVAAIVPFNYPVELYAHKAAAALAAGNAVIAKPPSECPLTLLKIAALIEEAGIPAAAHQMITGPGAVVGVSGRQPGYPGYLGDGSGHRPASVAELASQSSVVHARTWRQRRSHRVRRRGPGKGRDGGCPAAGAWQRQICCAVKRIFVEQPAYDTMADILIEKARQLKVGDQLDDIDVGPLISTSAAEMVEASINDAVRLGAVIGAGGRRRGAFIEPTVLTRVPLDVKLFNDEVFGPVAPLVAFKTVDEAVRSANHSPYGLQAAVFTRDVSRAFDIAYRLHAGGVIVNWSSALRVETLPFGGVKMSGYGREGIHDTLEEMTYQKTIVVHNAFSGDSESDSG